MSLYGLVEMSLGDFKNMTSMSKERIMEILEGQKKPSTSKDRQLVGEKPSLENLQEMFESFDTAARNPCTGNQPLDYLTC